MQITCPNYLLDPVLPVSVAIIGIGGTGSKMATNVCMIDKALKEFGHLGLQITLFDPDEVSSSNIVRQTYQKHEIGYNKAFITSVKINQFYGIQSEFVKERFDKVSFNVIISCVDTLDSRKQIKQLIENAIEQPESNEENVFPYLWIDCGNGNDYGQICCKAYHSKDKEEGMDFFDIYSDAVEDKTAPSCSLKEALDSQSLFVNTIAATLAGNMLWDLFRKIVIDYSIMFFNMKDFVLSKK